MGWPWRSALDCSGQCWIESRPAWLAVSGRGCYYCWPVGLRPRLAAAVGWPPSPLVRPCATCEGGEEVEDGEAEEIEEAEERSQFGHSESTPRHSTTRVKEGTAGAPQHNSRSRYAPPRVRRGGVSGEHGEWRRDRNSWHAHQPHTPTERGGTQHSRTKKDRPELFQHWMPLHFPMPPLVVFVCHATEWAGCGWSLCHVFHRWASFILPLAAPLQELCDALTPSAAHNYQRRLSHADSFVQPDTSASRCRFANTCQHTTTGVRSLFSGQSPCEARRLPPLRRVCTPPPIPFPAKRKR